VTFAFFEIVERPFWISVKSNDPYLIALHGSYISKMKCEAPKKQFYWVTIFKKMKIHHGFGLAEHECGHKRIKRAVFVTVKA